MLKLCALWRSKSGKCYTGRLGNIKMILLKNKYKNEEKQPDLIVCIDEYQEKEESIDEGMDSDPVPWPEEDS